MIRRLAIPGRMAFLALFVALAVVCAIAVNVADAARGTPPGNQPAHQPVPLPYGFMVNHLTNPGFDADADFNGAPDTWWLATGILTTNYSSPPWAINSHTLGYGTILSQDLNVGLPGTGSQATAVAYIAKPAAPYSTQLGFGVAYRDAGGNVYTVEIMRPNVITWDDQLREFTGTVTLPPTATKVTRFFVTRNEDGEYWIDNVGLYIDPYVPVWTTIKYTPYGYNTYDPVAAVGNRVWVGGGWMGGIQHSADGGTTWVTQTTSYSGTSYAAIQFLDANAGAAIGSDGHVDYTVDGGSTWLPQTSLPTSPTWYDTDLAGGHGWAVGSNGAIAHTANGGTSWVTQTSPVTNAYLFGVDFVDASNGWAVGYAYDSGYDYDVPYVLHTSNGGTTWVTQTVPITNGGLYGVSFVDASTGWAVGSNGAILHTTNGGATWVAQPSGVQGWFNNVAFADATHGCATGSGLYCTSDSGATWHTTPPTVTSAYMFMLSDIAYSGGVGWAVGSPYVVLRSGVPAEAIVAITGTARLQGRTNHAGALVSANPTATTVANGAFTITHLASGLYNVSASMAGYLTTTVRNVPVTAPQTTVLSQLLLLRGGDVVRDGIVDIYDMVAVGGNFGTTAAVADINGDGTVNIFDLVMVGANYGRTSEVRNYHL